MKLIARLALDKQDGFFRFSREKHGGTLGRSRLATDQPEVSS